MRDKQEKRIVLSTNGFLWSRKMLKVSWLLGPCLGWDFIDPTVCCILSDFVKVYLSCLYMLKEKSWKPLNLLRWWTDRGDMNSPRRLPVTQKREKYKCLHCSSYIMAWRRELYCEYYTRIDIAYDSLDSRSQCEHVDWSWKEKTLIWMNLKWCRSPTRKSVMYDLLRQLYVLFHNSLAVRPDRQRRRRRLLPNLEMENNFTSFVEKFFEFNAFINVNRCRWPLVVDINNNHSRRRPARSKSCVRSQ